jgi:hypothetical protein
MSIFEAIFGAVKKELTLNEVKRAEIKLQMRENQTISKLERIEKEREELFTKGAKIKSPTRRRQIARQYEQKSHGVKMMEHDLTLISKELTTIKALKLAFERREMARQGIGHILNRVDEAELMTLLEDDKISQEMYAEKLNEVMNTVNDANMADSLHDLGKEGSEVMNIWQKMDDGEIEDVEEAIKLADKAVREKTGKEKEAETE